MQKGSAQETFANRLRKAADSFANCADSQAMDAALFTVGTNRWSAADGAGGADSRTPRDEKGSLLARISSPECCTTSSTPE
jgi:hypothetical protein